MFFSENIEYLRKLKGLKQTEMLNEIGFKQSTWGGYETGKSVPKFEDLLKIAEYFDISESELIHKNLQEEAETEKKGPQKGGKEGHKTQPATNALFMAQEQLIASLRELVAEKERVITTKEQVISMLTEEVNCLKKESGTEKQAKGYTTKVA